jgi:hypothetical protein
VKARQMCTTLVSLVFVAACSDSGGSSESAASSRDITSHCVYVGNQADKKYCRTTFIELLAHPELFDGRRVLVKGWVFEQAGVLAVFPSKDAIDSAELNASLIIRSGNKRGELLTVLQANQAFNPRMLSVGGVFKMRQSVALEMNEPPIPHRFGELVGVDEIRP